MSIEKTVRNHFGWSQEQLAIYLGISRSLVKLAEAEERSLPPAAEVKLAHLQLFMLEKDITGKELPKADTPTPATKGDGKKLLRQASRYETLVEKTRQQLTDMQLRYEQAQASTALFGYLQPAVFAAAGEERKKDTVWLELIEAKAKLQLKRNGPAEQALLQWRIDCYRFAAERAKELGEKMK